MKLKTIAVASAAALMTASAAMAAVTFDTDTGTGFVGKGDVQLAFGWNNAAVQSNAKAVAIRFQQRDRYEAVCEWETITGGKTPKVIEHEITLIRNVNANVTVSVEPRTRNQVTGFNLTGFGAGTSSGVAPEVGSACPGAGNQDGIVTSATLVSSSGGLRATHNGVTVDLQ
jgi:hypothetical protein